MDAAWSRDGRQFVLWSSQNNQKLYLLSADGSGLVEKQMDVRIMGTPQFTPEGTSVVFYGTDLNAAGLFEVKLDTSQVTLINPLVKDPSGFAFSPDGSLLAYLEYDRDAGEARLITTQLATGERAILGKMDIPRKPGASLPESSILSWSADGNFLVFDFGQYVSERAIYLAPTDGSGLIKVVDPGYAPAISADGSCLAYINDGQVFLLDLRDAASNSTTGTPLLLAELPAGRGTANAKQDKLQWQP
jgi:Tol biopolymer transport system component